MNEYWSNEDDKKVRYKTERPARAPRVNGAARGVVPERADGDAFSYPDNLDPRDNAAGYGGAYPPKPQYGADRSSFISPEANARKHREGRPAYPAQPKAAPPPTAPYGGVYQVHSEQPSDQGGRRGNGFLKFLIVLLVLALIAGGAYVFRYDILNFIGSVFGEEAVARFLPTPAPTEPAPEVPAYVPSAALAQKSQAVKEIGAVTDGLDLNTYAVTEQNIVMSNENQGGTFDYYLFDYDTGRLLGYYDGISGFIPCGKNVFYIDADPYLVTSRGFPLADIAALSRIAGSDVEIRPMVNGWALVQNADATMLNYIGEDGKLISSLWYIKAFPFTAETTIAYVDTGNVTGTENRYALYLLHRDGTAKRLHYVPDTEDYIESVCGMAFTPDGEMHTQDEALTLLMTTDQATAYVNCGALVVRDPETGLFGLFVDGVKQYPFAFDSIEPVPSALQWEARQVGCVALRAVTGMAYPLPRSYNFVLRKGGTEQIVTIPAASVYPIILN
jgi:hypothetical protein